MKYFAVDFDVPFEFGDAVKIDQDPASWRDGRRPSITIDLLLVQLPIPDLTTTFGIYFATPALATKLRSFSGLRERQFTLSFDPQMEELGEFEGKELPELTCFEVVGTYPEHDFAHVKGVSGLLVSEQAWAAVQQFDLGDADVELYEPLS
ncbi:hypothetical protein CH252_05035 [Rhodococcus sp. 06-1477-1B]|nr:hypothetical protein CH252_05035 [Rhodococcus sp. 06-1477-1B]